MDVFERDLSATDWSLATENIGMDLSFKTFSQLLLFHRVLDKHAPFKLVSVIFYQFFVFSPNDTRQKL